MNRGLIKKGKTEKQRGVGKIERKINIDSSEYDKKTKEVNKSEHDRKWVIQKKSQYNINTSNIEWSD